MATRTHQRSSTVQRNPNVRTLSDTSPEERPPRQRHKRKQKKKPSPAQMQRHYEGGGYVLGELGMCDVKRRRIFRKISL